MGLKVHSIRHAAATHLPANGADIHMVQELLGHESIETTALYTEELHENIKRIYRSYHPRENEYYREVDEDYLQRLAELEKELTKAVKKRENYRQNRERYEKQRKRKRMKSPEWCKKEDKKVYNGGNYAGSIEN